MTRVSVVIPTWNGAATLAECLDGLFAQETPWPFDVLLIDSSSTDATREIAGRYPVRLHVIPQEDFDHGDTRNLGALMTTGELVAFLVQDAYPQDRNWLAALVSNFDDPAVAGAFSRIVPRPDASPLVRRGVQGDLCFATERVEARVADTGSFEALDPLQKRLLVNFNDVASCLRRSVWRELPFPRTPFGEDLAWAHGALRAGHTIVFDPRSVVVHSHDYDPRTIRARTRVDAWWNRAHLDRVCVATPADATALTDRAVDADRAFLEEAGIAGPALEDWLQRSRAYHREEYAGFVEGSVTAERRVLPRAVPGPLRVLFVLHSLPPETFAGTEVLTLTLARALRERGHEVVLLHRSADASLPDWSLSETSLDGFRVIRLAHHLRFRELREAWIHPEVERLFRHVLRAERPDVVHVEHLIHLSASLLRVAEEEAVPTVVTLNDYWFRCPRVQLVRADGTICDGPPPVAGCLPCVYEAPRAIPLLAATRPLAPLLARAARWYLGRLPRGSHAHWAQLLMRPEEMRRELLRASLLVAPSRFLKHKMVESGVPPERLLVSDYGMETAWLDAWRPRTPDGRVRFGFVGSLVPHKGPLVLAEAFARLDDARAELHVHGDHEGAPLFRETAAALRARAPRAVLHGRFEPGDVARVLSQVDVLVVPSTWFENSPLTVHEAFQARLPVVVSDVGGLRELVAGDRGGLRFAAGDAADLARVLRRFLDEPGLAARLGAAAPTVKTAAENAAEMEMRYRQVIGLARGARERPGR